MRLIDADALIEAIWKEHRKVEKEYDLCVDELKDIFCGVVALIDEQPTAYDVEKVADEIRDYFKDKIEKGKEVDGWCICAFNADVIGIVEKGGKE